MRGLVKAFLWGIVSLAVLVGIALLWASYPATFLVTVLIGVAIIFGKIILIEKGDV